MLVFALILWPLIEIAAGFAVAHAIGVLPCILLLLAGWPVGAALMRAQGRATVARLRDALATGRPPAGAESVLSLLAGPLLIIPGFGTDVLAGLLLVGPVRRRAWALLAGRVRGRFSGGGPRGGAHADDIDGTAHDTTRPGPVLHRPQLHR